MATTNKTSTTVAAAFPAKTAKAPAVVAKAGKLLAAAADGVPGTGPKRTIGDKLNAEARATKKAAPKKKDALTVLADQTIAAKAPAKTRSAAAKRAEPTGAKKVATKAAKPATARKAPAAGTSKLNGNLLPVHTVSNIGQLRAALDQFPHGAKFTTDRKFGQEIIEVLNLRGRKVAEIHRANDTKPSKK